PNRQPQPRRCPPPPSTTAETGLTCPLEPSNPSRSYPTSIRGSSTSTNACRSGDESPLPSTATARIGNGLQDSSGAALSPIACAAQYERAAYGHLSRTCVCTPFLQNVAAVVRESGCWAL